MSALVTTPPTLEDNSPNINWGTSAFGVFFGPQALHLHMVQVLVNTQWYKRGSIEVQRTSHYYIFTFSQRADLEALPQQHTMIIDGRIITFRRCQWSMVPQSINLSFTRIWVRVSDLFIGYMSFVWIRQALYHVGFVEKVEIEPFEPPSQLEIKAKLLLDLSHALIPGFVLPL